MLTHYSQAPWLIPAFHDHHRPLSTDNTRDRRPKMIPNFSGPNRAREINLGGASSTSSQAVILNEAKVRREQREDARRRLENAVKIQAWWRGVQEARAVRKGLGEAFDSGNGGVAWSRYLVVGWADTPANWARLERWSTAMLKGQKLAG